MQLKKATLVLLLLGIGLTGIKAQESLSATGFNGSGSGGSVSGTIGQVFYTNTITNGSVAQGVQQPFEISVETVIEEAKEISLHCMAYPNPATNFLTLKVENFNKQNLSYNLYDVNGKLLEKKNLESNETSMDMGNYVPATYFLKVIKDNKTIEIFKIIKN
jgi:hypothetical protein